MQKVLPVSGTEGRLQPEMRSRVLGGEELDGRIEPLGKLNAAGKNEGHLHL